MANQNELPLPRPSEVDDASIVLAAQDSHLTKRIGYKYSVWSGAMNQTTKRISAERVALAALRHKAEDDEDLRDLLEVCATGTVAKIQGQYRSPDAPEPRPDTERYAAIKAAIYRTAVQEPPSAPKRKAKSMTEDQESHATGPSSSREKRQKRQSPPTQEVQEVQEVEEGIGSVTITEPETPPTAHRQRMRDKWLGTFGARSLISIWSGKLYHECQLDEQMRIDQVLRVNKEWIHQECLVLSLVENIDELRQSLLDAVALLQEAQKAGARDID
ncbi:hypothetical protein PG984_006955 [Apiospora sp. TS-2023a]